MKSLFWFLLGIAGGFVVAHFVDKDPRGHELLTEVDARIAEFTDRIGDAYREQESRLTELVDGVTTTVANTASSAAEAVAGTAEAAADAAKKLTD